jgi:outer membrane protein insertion porin family
VKKFLILLACAAPVLAQNGSPGKWPIQTLTVEGNHVFPTAAILAVAGLKIGQLAGEPEFEAARGRLTATGAFETVGYKFAPAPGGKGFHASFQVSETTSIYPVMFEDLKAPDADIAAALAARDPLFSMQSFPASFATLNRESDWIEEFLAARGIRDNGAPVDVEGTISNIDQGKLVALFRPLKDISAVATISFEGNKLIPGSALRAAIAPSGIGSIYTERRFREILDAAVRPVYEARGHMRVSFPKIVTEDDPEVKGIHVTVTVNEGEAYALSNVSVAKPTPVGETELLHDANIKTGDVANFELISAGLDRIRTAVTRAGYLDAKVSMDREFDDAKRTAAVTFHIDAGPQYSMGKLAIKGLDLNGEAEIKRIWKLKLGDPFNPEYPDHFLQSVREQSVFDHLGKTRSETKVEAKTHAVDVTLTFMGDDDGLKKLTRRKL